MLIIHTGDLHLDTITVSHSPAYQRWHTFQRLISYANEQAADLLLICGDLFHHQPSEIQLREADRLFRSLTCTQVVIIAGNHDFIAPGAPMAAYPWCDQVTLLPTKQDSHVTFPELNTVIHGFSYSSYQLNQPPYCPVCIPDDDKMYHILMLHGGDADHLPLNFQALANSAHHYIALGHIHKPRIFPGNRMAYCGSLEPLDHTETGNHGFIQITLHSELIDLSFIPFSHTRYIPLSLQVTPEDTIFSLRTALTSRIARGLPGDRYSVHFTGLRAPEITISGEVFRDFPQLYDVYDETQPWYNFDHLCQKHGSDLIGQYIRTFLSPGIAATDLDDIHRQALYVGLRALLDSADKRQH